MDDIKSNKIASVVEEAMKSLKSIAEVNTVIGKPFSETNGNTIIPISKVTIAYIAGGGEYSAGENAVEAYSKENYPLSAGSGGFVQLTPIGFLVGKDDGLSTITIDESSGTLDKLIKAATDYIKELNKNDKKD